MMQVTITKSETKIKLTKREQKILSEARDIAEALEKNAQGTIKPAAEVLVTNANAIIAWAEDNAK